MTSLAPTSALAPQPSPTLTRASGIASDFDTFLQLLTTQLTNQDPTEPVDTETFTNQLVQFSQVEQQLQTNALLESLISQQAAASAVSAVNYIGQQAIFAGNDAVLPEGGASTYRVSFPQGTTSAQAKLINAAGQTVGEIPLEGPFNGVRDIVFDGQLPNGTRAPPGRYTLEVKAQDQSGDQLSPAVGVLEPITGLDLSQGQPLYVTRSGPRNFSEVLGLLGRL